MTSAHPSAIPVSVTAHYRPAFSEHPVRARDCEHPAHVTMFVGQQLVRPKRRKPYVAAQAVVCMDCGTKLHGQMPIEVALRALWDRYGWNYVIGKRLCQLSTRVSRQLISRDQDAKQ